MAFTLVMDVLAFSSAQFAEIDNICVNLVVRAHVLWIRRTGTNVERVDLKNVSKLE